MPLWQLYFGLSGRITRAHWWVGVISTWGAGIVLAGGAGLFIAVGHGGWTFISAAAINVYFGMLWLLALVLAWIQIALCVKRLHDRGRPGWALILCVLPPIALWFLFEMAFLEGEPRTNAWGPPFGRRDLSALREEFHRNDLFE